MVLQRTTRGKKKTATKATGHKHRAAGTKKGPSKKGLLAAIGKKGGTTKKAKEEKPTITLEDQAENLLALQQAKADEAEAKGRVKELEGELIPEMEEHRLGLCKAKGTYIRSINVRATGDDENGDEIKAGQALYYVQNRYSAWNPRAASTDEEVLEQVGEDATLRDEAIYHIAAALSEFRDEEVSWEDAEAAYDARIEEKDVVTLKEGALEDDAVIEVLQEHLLEWLESTTKATPSTVFHEKSHYDDEEAVVMEAMQGIGLCHRSKGTVKASGAPKPTRRAVRTR